MNEVSRISIRSVIPLDMLPADDATNTSPLHTGRPRTTKKLLEWASTAPVDDLAKLNEDISASICAVIDALRITTHAPTSSPLSLSLMRARWLASSMADWATLHGFQLAIPHVTVTDDETLFEWWRDDRKLTFYVTASAVEYVQVWGPDIVNEMVDGELEVPPVNLASVWRWLVEDR